MAEKKQDAPAKTTKAKPKRTILSPQERLKKAEAELAELRAKAEADTKKKVTKLLERRNGLIARALDITDKVYAIDLELESLGHTFTDERIVAIANYSDVPEPDVED